MPELVGDDRQVVAPSFGYVDFARRIEIIKVVVGKCASNFITLCILTDRNVYESAHAGTQALQVRWCSVCYTPKNKVDCAADSGSRDSAGNFVMMVIHRLLLWSANLLFTASYAGT